jgi:hypothetical protein
MDPEETGSALLDAWLAALEATALSRTVRESPWIYPAAEFLHIVGFVALVGSALLFDLRLLGLSRGLSVRALAGHALPWARAGLALVAPTGLVMFLSEPAAMAANPAFRIKLLLVAAGVANAWAFRWPFRSVHAWDRDAPAPVAARVIAILSLVLWLATLAAGRLIAYV